MGKNKILTKLPMWGIGSHEGKINWKATEGMELELSYNDKIYKVKIFKYEKYRLWIDYNGYVYEKGIKTGHFRNGGFGKVLGIITKDFKKEIGESIKDDKRDLIITDREYRKNKNNKKHKYYKYTCNKCGWEDGWIREGHLDNNIGCSCCCGRTAVLGINTIYDTDRWMMDLGVSEEDAKTHTYGCNDKIEVACPNCGKKRKTKISYIYKYKSIACSCGDGQSYISKYIMSALDQLNIKYDTEVKYDWNKYVNPLTNKESQASIDFVLYHNNREIPLEADGAFHRNDNKMNGMTKEHSEYIDKQRDDNCLKYLKEETIRISNEGDIKENILNSKLNDLFNLSTIDWLKCEEFSLKNIVKEVCEYWNNKEEWETTKDVGKVFKIHMKTIREYLEKGNKLEWCEYNSRTELGRSVAKNGKLNSKTVEIFKDGESLGIFESCAELSRQSEELFGVKLLRGHISMVCVGNRKHHKGFIFKYI